MGAICGIVNTADGTVSLEQGNSMLDELRIYKLDDISDIFVGNAFFGCGIQYITPQSLNEALPFHDKEAGLAITADAIIDNREELFDIFNIGEDQREYVTDSELILLAYKKWGQCAAKYLVGDFAFVIWDEIKKDLFCARDHVGKRTFYYYYKEKTFVFCTTMIPILKALGSSGDLNEKWMTDFLSIEMALHEIDCETTVYKDICQLPPASTLTLTNKDISIKQYWNPLELPKVNYNSDGEYEKAFLNVFYESVRCRLRTNNPVGIMLSGGLDSGSVACIASKILSERGSNIKAYCSVPSEDYAGTFSDNVIADESEYVEAIRQSYDNIEVNYCDSKGRNAYGDIELFINILEQPYKAMGNIQWINEIYETAAKDGCKTLLNGQYGNFTISYGYTEVYLLTLFKSGKLRTLIREIRAYSSANNIPVTKLIKSFLRMLIPYSMRKLISDLINGGNRILSNVIVNPELASKWNIDKRFKKKGYNSHTKRFVDLKQHRKIMMKPEFLTHIASMETKLSLYHGIIHRDPTRDKRLIEFCFRIPGNQYVNNGIERNLIRRAMEGILPDKIRLNKKRGVQAIDWIQKLEPCWTDIENQVEDIILDKDMNRFLDMKKLKNIYESIKINHSKKQEYKIRTVLIGIGFYSFFKNLHKQKKKELLSE
jgi:asparagine synthase (glutamine-hydrolysing)